MSWLRILFAAAVIFLAFVSAMELRLAARGFRPAVVDSPALWAEQRRHAAALGQRALILVGASRMQLDVDLDVLRRQTGLYPVQLAIDGGSFMPVLEDLAADPAVTGTVVVSYQDHVVAGDRGGADVASYVQAFHEDSARGLDFHTVEAWLTSTIKSQLRSYADGARPLTALRSRILQRGATPQYLVTLHDRSRLADYRKVEMPAFYFSRVIRNLGADAPQGLDATSWKELDEKLRDAIEQLKPASRSAFDVNVRRVAELAHTIERRGGKVVFVMLPKSGLVAKIDDRRYPRREFWDVFAASAGVPTLHYGDVAALSEFVCPDGSHLDYRDRNRFTAAWIAALNLH